MKSIYISVYHIRNFTRLKLSVEFSTVNKGTVLLQTQKFVSYCYLTRITNRWQA
jgi:hypothetical protein